MEKKVLVSKDGPLAVLTLNHPPVNHLDRGLLQALGKAVGSVAGNGDVSVVAVTGGDVTFSEGLEARSFVSMGAQRRRELVKLGQEVLARLERVQKPTIAAMAGNVLGAGLELALACDVRLASEDARFGHPEVSQGFIPALGNVVRLERLVGPTRARALMFFGEPIRAWEALEIGLVSKVVPREALQEEARLAARRIAAQPGSAVAALKAAMIEARQGSEQEALESLARILDRLLDLRKK